MNTSAGFLEHTYTQSVCTVCKKYTHDEHCAHFFLKVALGAHFSWSPKTLCELVLGCRELHAHLFWPG